MGVSLEATAQAEAGSALTARGIRVITATLFITTALLGTGLAYGAVPVLVRMLLADYGGSPMVWSVSVFFLQAALFAGCFLAYWTQRLPGARLRFLIQISMIAAPLFLLPFTVPGWSLLDGPGSAWLSLLLALAAVAGAPLAALSMAGPLLLTWYSEVMSSRASNPYFLAAIGNGGGLLVLAAYPYLIEPIAHQPQLWMSIYGLFASLAVACRLSTGFHAAPAAAKERVSWRRRARWTALAFVPSALMLAATTHISTELYMTPVMWLLPLGAYLVTFVIAFGLQARQWVNRVVTVAALSAAVVPWAIYLMGYRAQAASAVLSVALVLVGGLACHGLLAKDRLGPARPTEFFLFIALGAALGGAFATLLAPVVFVWVAELPLAIAALAFVPVLGSTKPVSEEDRGWRFPGAAALVKAFVLAVPLLAVAVYINLGVLWLVLTVGIVLVPWCVLATRHYQALAMAAVLATVALFWYQIPVASFRERTFFGSYRIYVDNGWQMLADGPLTRGYQYTTGPGQKVLASYYGRRGPFGDLFAAYGDPSKRVAVIGMGTGVVAGYGRPGEKIDFYDLDPAAVDIATHRFSYVRGSKATVSVVTGDGRSRLARQPDGTYGLVVLDAIASAGVPFHLLTKQALETYARKLRPGGVVAFNVSNSVPLAPIIQATARSAGLAVLTGYGAQDRSRIYQASFWVVAARSAADFKPLLGDPARWRPWPTRGAVWNDGSPVLFDTGKTS